jgi:glycosyltransferase involved in cell wall biosynthesis
MENIKKQTGVVSVIIPGYKSSYIVETIESALCQTYQNIEIIVVDDGSPNNLGELLDEFIRSDKIRYIYQENQKMAAARNNGIRNAKGEFIAFLDDDDLWEPKKIEKQLALFNSDDIGLVYTYAEGFNDFGSVNIPNFEIEKNGRIFTEIFLQDFIANSSVMVRKGCFDKLGVFNTSPSYFGVDDCDLWTRVSYHYSANCLCEKMTLIRLHDEQFSGDKTIMYENDLRVRKNLIEELEVPIYYRKKYFARMYFNIGFENRYENKTKAASYYIKSFKAKPSIESFFYFVKINLY